MLKVLISFQKKNNNKNNLTDPIQTIVSISFSKKKTIIKVSMRQKLGLSFLPASQKINK